MAITKSKVFLFFSLSFIGGIGISSFYYPRLIDLSSILLGLALGLIIIICFYKNKLVLIAGFSFIFFLIGLYLTTSRLTILNSLSGAPQNFSGEVMVTREPEVKDKFQRLVVKPKEKTSDISSKGHPMSQAILVTTNLYPQYQYGDLLRLDAKLELPPPMEDFDYRMYLAKENIFYLGKNPKMENLNHNNGNIFYRWLIEVKNKLMDNTEKLLPSPTAGLLIGLIIGGASKLPSFVQDEFSRTGLSHIVAVSGYNVTIVAEYLMLMCLFLGFWRRQAFWFAVIGIFLFVLMIGFPSSAVRAALMGTLLLWAMKNGRLANSQNAILCAASIMLLINPLLLRWDVGFQLSFLATLGIVYIYPLTDQHVVQKVKDYHKFIPMLLEILFLTLSAQVFVLPIILYNFNQLSIISPLANLLVLPIVPFTMMLGFLMLLFSLIFPPLATIFSWLIYLPLKYETAIIHFMAGLKYSAVTISFSWWGVCLWYIIVVGLIYFHKKHVSA